MSDESEGLSGDLGMVQFRSSPLIQYDPLIRNGAFQCRQRAPVFKTAFVIAVNINGGRGMRDSCAAQVVVNPLYNRHYHFGARIVQHDVKVVVAVLVRRTVGVRAEQVDFFAIGDCREYAVLDAEHFIINHAVSIGNEGERVNAPLIGENQRNLRTNF